MLYAAKTPFWLKWLYPSLIWDLSQESKKVFLSFDDGPHPQITPFVLDELKKFEAKATFFCIADNVRKYPETFERILQEGHQIGNHTFNHLNGWKTSDIDYLRNIERAKTLIDSDLFRPPYGKIRRSQIKAIKQKWPQTKIIMWDVLSADFDNSISENKCLNNVITNVKAGSIIVFHDSEKAFPKMRHALPATLKYLHDKGFDFETIK